MKTILFIIGAVLLLNPLSSFPNQKLRIANISENQEVTGSVVVKLLADNLADYKKVSYCVDDHLIWNVYDAPFTIEFDSRDFENGVHELSVRGIHKSGLMHSDTVNIRIKNSMQDFNIVINNPRKMLTGERNNYRNNYIDCPHTVLKKNDCTLYFFQTQGLMMHERENQGILYRSSGTLEQPIEIIESGKHVPKVWDKGGHKTQGIWLMGIYKTGENELLGFTHNESCYEEDKPCNSETKYFSLGVGYSQDNGETWQYCGDIIRTPRYGKEGDDNIKGVPYILKDEYFYIYFWEFPEKGVYHPAVARAKITDVIAAARKGKNVDWKKYNNGNWNEDGLTGLASNIMDNLDETFNMHCKVSYVPSIQKYFMITYVNGKQNVYILLSDDGLKWEIAESIIDHNTDARVSYPFIGDFYTDDCHEVGNDFYIYWARNYRDLWGARVNVRSGN
jgi:hypothetical protein